MPADSSCTLPQTDFLLPAAEAGSAMPGTFTPVNPLPAAALLAGIVLQGQLLHAALALVTAAIQAAEPALGACGSAWVGGWAEGRVGWLGEQTYALCTIQSDPAAVSKPLTPPPHTHRHTHRPRPSPHPGRCSVGAQRCALPAAPTWPRRPNAAPSSAAAACLQVEVGVGRPGWRRAHEAAGRQ